MKPWALSLILAIIPYPGHRSSVWYRCEVPHFAHHSSSCTLYLRPSLIVFWKYGRKIFKWYCYIFDNGGIYVDCISRPLVLWVNWSSRNATSWHLQWCNDDSVGVVSEAHSNSLSHYTTSRQHLSDIPNLNMKIIFSCQFVKMLFKKPWTFLQESMYVQESILHHHTSPLPSPLISPKQHT